LGIGGGIITKKLLLAVLLIASLSLGGIADASAAEVGTAQTTTSNTNTLNEDTNNQLKSESNGIKSAETHNNADKYAKRAKTAERSKSNCTQSENKTSEINTTEIKKTEKTRYTHKHRVAKKRVSSQNSVTKQTTNTVNSPVTTTQDLNDDSFTKQNTTLTDKKQVSNENSVTNQTKATVKNTTTKFDPEGKYASSGTTKYKIVKKTIKVKVYKYKRYKIKKKYRYKGKWRYKIYYKYKKVFVGYKYRVTTYKVPIESNVSSANSSSIASLSNSLKGNSEYDTGNKIFNWVRDNINYSFYYNTKYGAANTLKYRQGNCVDHSHLIVALARNAGLKARYVHATAKFTSGNTYGHVWAQILVNGKWIDADATSSQNSFGVIKNWSNAVIHGIYDVLPF